MIIKAASSKIAHETLKKIASDRKTLSTHDIDEAFEIPMDPIQDTTEEARNVQKAIRQSIASMNLVGGVSQAGELSSSCPKMEGTKSIWSTATSKLSSGRSKPSSSGSPIELSPQPFLSSTFESGDPQGTEAHSVEEEEETLTRKKPSSRTRLRFRNPLSLSNPPGKKKQTTAQAQDQPEQGSSTSIETSTTPTAPKSQKA
ncbi:hypothetical protein BGZ97_007820, partial [Linnemannia gamsii]